MPISPAASAAFAAIATDHASSPGTGTRRRPPGVLIACGGGGHDEEVSSCPWRPCRHRRHPAGQLAARQVRSAKGTPARAEREPDRRASRPHPRCRRRKAHLLGAGRVGMELCSLTTRQISALAARADCTTAPSMHPPDTEPAMRPSEEMAIREPAGRGEEPQVRTTQASTTSHPSSNHRLTLNDLPHALLLRLLGCYCPQILAAWQKLRFGTPASPLIWVFRKVPAAIKAIARQPRPPSSRSRGT